MNKLLIAAFLLVVILPVRGQTPSPSSSSGAESAAASSSPAKNIDPVKEQLIRRVMARTKEAELAQERILQGLTGMKLMMPRVPEKFWDKYRQLINVEELRNRLVSVYDKHYTADELNELLKFYDSPAGKKMSDEAVPVLRDSMGIAQELSKRATQSVAADFQAEQLLQRPRSAGSLGPLTRPQGNPTVAPEATSTPTPTATAP